MLADYRDITSRIAESPKWWDSNGVPRYDDFRPDDAPDIYAREAVLYRIECQECGRSFLVGEDWGLSDESPLSVLIESGHLHYGDPPRHDDCLAGDTMNCVDREVVEFWDKSDVLVGWRRVPELEGIDLTPQWWEAR